MRVSKRYILGVLAVLMLVTCLLTPVFAASNGWSKQNGKWYFYENGKMVTSQWKSDAMGWCYLGADGAMVTNRWLKDSAGWCYVGADGYCVTNQWMRDSVGWVYLDREGRMVTNRWLMDSQGWCYVGADGYAVTNCWKKDSIGWIWLNANGSMTKNAWILDGGKWYFLDANGYMVANQWRKDSKGWCWLTASGAMAVNQWVQDSKGWCYVGADGYCLTNCWAMDSHGWIWLDNNGSMVKNSWISDGGKWYYLNDNGYRVTGWKRIGAYDYYFYPNGAMAANTTIDGRWLDAEGRAERPVEKPKLSIGLPANAMITSHDDNALTNWVETQTGTELSFVEYAGGTDIATQISTTIAANQELPDILYGVDLNEDTYTRYGKDGYFVDLTPYFDDKEKSKVFWDRLAELTPEQQEAVLLQMKDPDTGKIYAVPSIETSLVDTMNYQVWINTVWLDRLGLEKPTNTDELYEVLKAFKVKDPNGNGIPDEIPLLGSQNGALGAKVIDWLINLFLYYDPAKPWQPDANGKLQSVYTQDAYREALKFVNKLYQEGLLCPLTWTSIASELKTIYTPSTGTALCGIFVGHLTSTTRKGSPILYEYEPLQTWGCAVERDFTCKNNTFITEDCQDVDAAFQLLMTLFSEEGSMRVRYGEYGTNWTDADPGATSLYGLPARYKLIDDPSGTRNNVHWSRNASTLIAYAEGETAQLSEQTDDWTAYKANLHAQSRKLFDEAARRSNPTTLCPLLRLTEQEEAEIEHYSVNVAAYWEEAQVDFITGYMDINSDEDWLVYLTKPHELGLAAVEATYQTVYDRTVD